MENRNTFGLHVHLPQNSAAVLLTPRPLCAVGGRSSPFVCHPSRDFNIVILLDTHPCGKLTPAPPLPDGKIRVQRRWLVAGPGLVPALGMSWEKRGHQCLTPLSDPNFLHICTSPIGTPAIMNFVNFTFLTYFQTGIFEY